MAKEYIEREAALKFKLAANLRPEKTTVAQAVADAIAAYINSIPIADVRPVVRGRWLINPDGYYPYCSACGQEPQGRVLTDYCPNCGARMGAAE